MVCKAALIAVALAEGLLGGLIAPVYAQSDSIRYVPTVWQTEQGLPSNSVNAIVQDRDGYLWVATNAGLARFDGVRFRIFGGDDFPSLRSSRFQSLYAAPTGELWIGTRNGGLIRLHDGTVTTYLERDGLPSTNILSIREGAGGKLWVNTIGGVACCAGGDLRSYPTYRGKAVSEFLLESRDGSVWFRSGSDVARFGPHGSVAILPDGFMVREARDGSVWVGFRHQHRLRRYHGGEFSDVPLPEDGVRRFTGVDTGHGVAMPPDPRETVLAMATDTDGELLILTPTGFLRAVDGKLSPPQTLPIPSEIGDPPQVLNLMADREGNRWVGTVGKGLLRFRRAPVTAYGKDEGLSDSPFRAVFQDREGRIWLGGDAGLHWFDGHEFHLVSGLAAIGAIAQTNDGELWFGGSGAVYRWRSGAVTRFPIESPSVFQILQDREGKLWVIAPTYEQKWRLYQFHDGKFDQIEPDVVNMAEDRDGGLWLGSLFPPALQLVRRGTTVLYDQRNGVPPNGVHSFYQEPSGALWFSTTTGLYRLRDGQVRGITAKNGLNTEITSILDDGKGNLWLPSDRGIFRLSLRDANDIADGRISYIPAAAYGVNEGMKTSECNGGVPGAWRAKDGRIWFPTMRGVVAIDPRAVSGPAPVVLEEAWANDLKLGRNGRTSVKAGSNTFDFTFTALNLSAPERQRFKYRLDPFDKDWVDAGTRRTAHYTNMPPGEYSFRIIAANSFGVWNDQGAGVGFVLLPRFYQTNWFRVLWVAAFLVLVWAGYQVRLRRLQRESNRLRDVVETIPANVWSARPDGSVDFMNRRWLEFSGLSPDKALGWGWADTLHPEDRGQFLEKLHTGIQSGEAIEAEARMRRADGQYRWMLFRNVPLRDKTGKIVKWYGKTTDIDDRKHAEEEVRNTGAQWQATFDAVKDLVLLLDRDFRILRANHAAAEFLGLPFDKIVGGHCYDLIHRMSTPPGECPLAKMRQSARHEEAEVLARPGGPWLSVSVDPVFDANGELTQVVHVARDITDRKRAEEALHESETRFRTFVDHAGDALFVYDLEQRTVVDVNRSACESLGYTRQELVGQTPFAFHLDSYQAYLDSVAERAVAGETVIESHWHRRKDGTVFPVEVHTTLIVYEGRRFLLMVARDITDRVRAEEAVRQSEKQLRDVIDTIPAYVWSALPDGSLDFLSKRCLEFSGDSFEESLGPGWEHVLHPEDRDRFLEEARVAFAAGEPFETEARYRRADGQYRWLLVRAVPLRDETGTIIKWYGANTDIDDRKRAEEALRRSEAYLAETQRLTHTGTFAADCATAPLYWSDELFCIFGFDPQGGLPTQEQPLQRIHPEDLDNFKQAWERVLNQKVDVEVEYRIVLPDGTVKQVYGLGHPVLNAAGEIVEVVGTTIDITDRKRAEVERERLRELEADLAHIDRVSMLGELAASIAHEVNQPLAGIVSNGSACLRWLAGAEPNIDEAREAVRDIVRDGKRAGEIIARIRAMTKRSAPPREKLDVTETIREVLALVGDEAKRKNVVIRTQFAGELSPVSADRVQLQQVVLNLVMNAMDAMSSVVERERQLVITTQNLGGEQVQVTVEDVGTGLEPDKLARIFEPFYTTKSGGMGMGLSISRSILQSHGGRLWATLNEGPGTSFHFTLPKYQGEESHAGAAAD